MTAVDFALLSAWADRLRPVAEEAGRATLEVRKRGFEVMAKNDTSPVTEADQIAEGIITAVCGARWSPFIPTRIVSVANRRVLTVSRRFISARTRERSSVGVKGFVMKSSAPTATNPLSAATGRLPDATRIIME